MHIESSDGNGSFLNLGLSNELIAALESKGYESPTKIQKQAIPAVLQGKDLTGIAETGTGKTGAFVLPMIDILSQGRTRARMPRSLILEPTRELAVQVSEQFATYGQNHNLTQALLIGGVAFGDQDKALERGADVLIATPGRLLDQFERSRVILSGIEVFVIDEADRMLDMGFIPDIEKLCSLLSPRRQTLLFSATMPAPIKRLTDQFQVDPKTVEVSRPATANQSIRQSLIEVEPMAKRNLLRYLLRQEDIQNAIIFCNRKRDVRLLSDSLKRHDFSSGQLHGDMDQPERLETLEAFRNGKITFLVASDVAARGLDIPGVSHVINFDVPYHPDDYIHRIGRTGRAGREGCAFMLATSEEAELVSVIEKLMKQDIQKITDQIPEEALTNPYPQAKRRKPSSSRRKSHADNKMHKRSKSDGVRKRSAKNAKPKDRVDNEHGCREGGPGRKVTGNKGSQKKDVVSSLPDAPESDAPMGGFVPSFLKLPADVD